MLISYQHRFIFVHVFKNAGTSIEAALLPYATENWVHLYAYRALYRTMRAVDKMFWRTGSKTKVKVIPLLPLRWNPQPLRNHATADQIAEKIGSETFDSYFSFSVVRNPWDWQVSRYLHIQRAERHGAHERANRESFHDFLKWQSSRGDGHNSQKRMLFSEGGEQLVDFICRFENLPEDFAKVCAQIGIDANLPRLNVSARRPYQEYYTPETVEMVREACMLDIETFGYDFE